MVTLFVGSMMGLVYSANLILLYVFWEITAITSWRLIGFFRQDFQVRRADKAFLVTALGALAMLLGFVMLWGLTGSFDLAVIRQKLAGQPFPALAVGLILMGILSKSSTLPFHTWLPDAGVAPSPVTALLHAAVLVKIGVYVFARLMVATVPLTPAWQTAVLVIAAASALVTACAALIETDMKRIIAYSTVSQIAFIFLGLASGTVVGVAGGLLYILMHGLAKGGLFLSAGIVEQNTHTKDIRQMGGLMATMPITAVAFALCAFSVMGIPPLGGFFSKYMVLRGGIEGGHLWISLVFVAGAVLTILYLFRLFAAVFLGQTRLSVAPKEGSPLMVGCVALLAGLSLLGGLWISVPSQWTMWVVSELSGLMK
jgi:NADH:ubiquinone oxidoreductase subunit 5 (subunit L)/multisubunit Na+/H+ antiporter MnhA subunit